MSKKAAAIITMFVAVRYFVKSTKSIISIIVSGDKRYTVTLNRNKQHTCTCDGNAVWHKTCKHIKHCIAIENARASRSALARKQQQEAAQVAQPAQAAQVSGDNEIEQLVCRIEEEMQREDAALAQSAQAAPHDQAAPSGPRPRSEAPLHSQGFSLLKR